MISSTDKFKPWDGEYNKQYYDVLLPDGRIIATCWPNAGKMVAMNGSGKMWSVEDKIQVRESIKLPWE
jgi:hypothetical protein